MVAQSEESVIVVGAGPVGLALALGLVRAGIGVRVVDRAPRTKREQRAAVLWPRAVEVLDDLGVAPAISERAHHLRSVDVHVRGRYRAHLDLGRVASAHPHPLLIEQHDVERLLEEQLAHHGVRIGWSTEVLACRADDVAAEVDLRDPDGATRTVTAAWVVGCEGTASVVRRDLGIPFEGRRRPNLQVVQVDARPTWSVPHGDDHGYFFLAPEVSLAAFPMPDDTYRFFAFTTDPRPDRRDPPTPEEMRRLVAEVSGHPEVRLELTEPVWLSRARFSDRVAATLRRGRGLLAGDAAHAWAPIGGHGMNTGIRGAHNLAWKLAAVHRGEARDVLLDTYCLEQRAAARAVMAEMRFNVLELPLPGWCLSVVDALLPAALGTEAVRRRVELTLSDLAMHYRGSPLSRPAGDTLPVRPGDRLPDVTVVVDGQRRPLHSLASYRAWTLLVVGAPQSQRTAQHARDLVAGYLAPIDVAAAVPADGVARQALGRRPALVLVRPDGHVALTARGADLGAVRTHLDRFLVPATERAAVAAGRTHDQR